MDAKIAVLIDDGHQDREFWYPKTRLEEEGAEVDVVTREERTYESEHGYEVEPDLTIDEVDSSDYDAVVLPGGRASPDALRTDDRVLEFVSGVYEEDKLVAAICHAGWVPISAGIVEGHEATCYHSIKDDLENAGAEYRDEEVVVSDNLVTSRHPGDLTEWLPAIINRLS
ncbi:MAG: type 1 glutamine amidotransferase domain-containing protein [Candidatus Nanohaloarchaea archaeon]|nr:type 1 glutamine amidotransferase domain-containing protein [Candidatus Nanohaloarchaea archaeon]